MWGPNVGRFLVRKSRVLQQRPVGLHEKTSDNIRLAKKFDRGQYEAIDCLEAEGFRKFEDVRLEPYQCSVPGYNDEATAISLMWRACNDATRHLDNPWLDEALWDVASYLCELVRVQPDYTDDILQFIRHETQHRVLAIVDRDPGRRASMSEAGYILRLHENFASRPELYKEMDTTPEEIAIIRHGMAVSLLPKRYWKNTWTAESNPQAYLTYKGKCFAECGTWSCKSDHNHMR